MKLKNKKSISIDFGSKYIKIVVGEYKNNHLKIDKLISKEIDENVYSDGRIQDFGKMKDFLLNLLKENKVKTKNIFFTISSSAIIKREIEIPRVDFNDRANLVKYEIEQYVPEDIEKYIIQYRELEDIEVNEELYSKVFVAAIPKLIVDEYYNFFKEIKFNPILFDVHCNSILKALNYNYDAFHDNDGKAKGVVALDIGYNSINITVIENGTYQFSRMVNVGLSQLDEVIMNDDEIDNININNNYEHIFDLNIPEIEQVLDFMGMEIKKIIDFYLSRDSDKEIDRIVIYGGGAIVKYISIHFMKELNVKVEKFKISDKLEFKVKDDLENAVFYVNAIGALIYG